MDINPREKFRPILDNKPILSEIEVLKESMFYVGCFQRTMYSYKGPVSEYYFRPLSSEKEEVFNAFANGMLFLMKVNFDDKNKITNCKEFEEIDKRRKG